MAFVLGLPIDAAFANSLNKCLDVYGKVTYSNLPCKGANEVRKVEIDPAPPVPVTPMLPSAAQSSSSKSTFPPTEKKAEIKLETLGAPKKPSQNNCDTLSDKLGLVLDKMDAARRKGYTQKQMDDWNSDIKTLERKKQQAGCF